MSWLILALVLLRSDRFDDSGRTDRSDGAGNRETRRTSRRVLQLCAGSAVGAMSLALLPMPSALIAGLALGTMAAHLTGRIRDRPKSASDDSAPLVLALTAAALRSGLPVATALDLARPAAGHALADALGRTAGLLRLGATPAQAWSLLPDGETYVAIALFAKRSGQSGTKLAEAFERGAARLLDEHRAAALARAQRVSVLAVGPLGACFLPAFVCLGIIPVVVAVAAGIGGQLR